jgi:hypothetical protein
MGLYQVEAQSYIFKEGDQTDYAYIVNSGNIHI